jgi:GNAT superfamily N-acetyltransferase
VLIEEWWPEAAAAARGVREPVALDGLHRMIDETGAGTLVIARAEDSAPIGLLVYRLADGGWLELRFLAMAKALRGWGYGSEAVRLIEASGMARRYAARVADGNGLGLYFWLRMGYRPADAGQLPQLDNEPEDGITMVRDQKE